MAVLNLYHARVISGVVARPGGSILHNPSIFWFLLSFCYQCIDFHFEFFVFSLHKDETLNDSKSQFPNSGKLQD